MDRNSSLERRYSFNAAQSIPVAESTHLSGNSFSWGSSSISPKQRSNSSYCLNNTERNVSRTILTSPKNKHVTKIDARIVADVQSKGLASRIVKYHESGTRLNRSMSAHNLYSKPGQFPVVTLTKTDLPYRATKQTLSMTRIAPPEKSMFYGNSLSSLLRSNSVVGLQKSNEDISRENRPILHPPPTENDMAPTRSVLDVLKEISRKRINSDDLDTTEASKKYCNRAGNDLVDTGINSSYPNIPTHLISSGKSFKRHRDVNAPYQNIQVQESRTSPEQAKKRLCNYNNDITSSLSSSKKSKAHDQKRSSFYLNQTMPTNLESYETQKAKVQRQHELNNTQDDMRFDNLANNLRNVDNIKPITPIPATPCTQDPISNGVAPQRAISEPICKLDDRKPTLNGVQPANKPRLTLFNKNYDVDTEQPEAVTVAENEDDASECAGIQFVKPKKITSKSGFKNPVIERTQKSKLALMLSGLRGELYQSTEFDELDSSKAQNKSTVDKSNNTTPTTTTTSTSNAFSSTTTTLSTVTTSSTSNNMGELNASITNSLTTKLTTISPKTSPPNGTSSPLVGLKLTPKKSTIDNGLSLNTVNKSNTNASVPPSNPSIPVLGGFSFGTCKNLTNTLATDTTTSSRNIVAASNAPGTGVVVGFVSSPQSPSCTAITNTTNAAPLINFGTTPVIENSLSTGSFSVPPKSVSITTSTPSVISNNSNLLMAPKTSVAMSFGTTPQFSSTSAGSAQTHIGGISTLNNITKTNAAFSFGMSSTATTTASSGVTPTIPNTSSFGLNSTATTSSAAPVFGAVAITAANNVTSTSFSFGQPPSQPISTTNSSSGKQSGGFNFTSNSPRQASTFAVENSAATKSQTPSISTTTPFSFGTSTTTAKSDQSSSKKGTASSVFNINPNKDNSLAFNTGTPSVFGSAQPNFGSLATSAPVFGSSTANPSKTGFGPSNATSQSVFGTGPSNSNTQTFGSNADNKSTSVFGSISAQSAQAPTFAFGSKTSDKTNTNNLSSTPSGGFSFGAPTAITTATAGGSFAFSGTPTVASTSNSSTSSTNNTFGSLSSASALPSKTFAFGSSNNKSENISTNLFGDSTNKPVVTSTAGGFSFGSANVVKPSNPSTFSFGSNVNSVAANSASNNGASAGFSFGSSAAPTKSSDNVVNKPFSFSTTSSGTPQSLGVPTNNSSSSNIFGTAPTAKPAPPAFNFASATNSQPSAPSPNNNIFAPPPTNIAAGPGDRPIRRATRRLQK